MSRRRGAFLRALAERGTAPEGRRWLFVPYDQLSDGLGPLSRDDPSELGIIIVENPWKAGRRPYHRQKLALVLANLRHFALEQAARGVAVRYEVAAGPYRTALQPLIRELGPLRMMAPAERELKLDLQPLVQDGGLQLLPHEGWLTTPEQFARSQKRPPWRMDAFYRLVRREGGILMANDAPVGGKFSFDADNRRPWTGEPIAPAPPRFNPDPITCEVEELVESRFRRHPGTVDLEALPATAADARKVWSWAKRRCLPTFGPFEDAMSVKSTNLFHTRIAALMNLHRLLPRNVIRDALRLDLPLASKEGFLRQVLGWREFMHHVHEVTDGLRKTPGAGPSPVTAAPGDGGYRRWSGRSWAPGRAIGSDDGGAAPSALGADDPLPPAFWGVPSGMECLDRVVASVWAEGYSHHITRLMILSNLATLLNVSPRQLTDWFWIAYTDAYDWVVEPNVLGMGTFAVGDLFTTKPYVSGAAYIDRMSDYCSGCAFDPKKSCPVTPLYWAFLQRHRKLFRRNPRMRIVLSALGRRDEQRRRHDAAVFRTSRETLAQGDRLAADMLQAGSRRRPRDRRRSR